MASQDTGGAQPTKNVDQVIPPNTRKFLELLMKKLEKNLKEQQARQYNDLRTEINVLRVKLEELEEKVKKNTPLSVAAPLRPAMSNKLSNKSSNKSNKSSNNLPPTRALKIKKTTSEYNKKPDKKKKALKRSQTPTTSNSQTQPSIKSFSANATPIDKKEEFDDDDDEPQALGAFAQNPDLSSVGSNKKGSSTSSTPQSARSSSKSPREKSRSKSPARDRAKSKGKGSKRNVLNNTSSAKSFMKGMNITVGNRYLLKDDRYGICRWYDGKNIGIELEIGEGDSDGTFNGKKRFKCDDKKAVFIQVGYIQMDCGKP